MVDDTEKSSLERIVEALTDEGVEFLIVGGQAEALFGSPRVTYDVDLCYRRTSENLVRLAQALGKLKLSLRGAPPDLPFRIDAQSLALGSNFTFTTDLGDLDLLGYLEPLGGYEELVGRAERFELGDREVNLISLDDLIRIKSHLGRPKDRESLLQLLAIKKIREG
jgi:predicted nucleotidyltransferase